MKQRQTLLFASKTCFYCLMVLLVSLLKSPSFAQSFIYAKGMSNTDTLGGVVVGNSIKVDNMGNTYVTGNFRKMWAPWTPISCR